jgi:6-pyruvoyltetrahydropterin/6-carboxytetrahydropterin synthase
MLVTPDNRPTQFSIDNSSIRIGFPSMFRVTQHIDFCYGHRLLEYSGKCRHLHGHNGRAVIVMEGAELGPSDMLVDFAEIKNSLRTWIESELDHRMILCQDDPALPMMKELGEPIHVISGNPTAENIARLIHNYAHEQGFPVVEVSLWETPNSFATYRG